MKHWTIPLIVFALGSVGTGLFSTGITGAIVLGSRVDAVLAGVGVMLMLSGFGIAAVASYERWRNPHD